MDDHVFHQYRPSPTNNKSVRFQIPEGSGESYEMGVGQNESDIGAVVVVVEPIPSLK